LGEGGKALQVTAGAARATRWLGSRGVSVREPVSARFTRGYVRVSLFLGAYAPLVFLFGIRLLAKAHPMKAYFCFGVSVLMAVALWLMFIVTRAQPQDYKAEDASSGAEELAGFIATYLLPFIMVGDVSDLDLLAYSLYFVIVAIVCLRGGFLHLNPLLALFGFSIYTINTLRGRRLLVLSRDAIERGDTFEGRELCTDIIISTNNRSAREREQQRIPED